MAIGGLTGAPTLNNWLPPPLPSVAAEYPAAGVELVEKVLSFLVGEPEIGIGPAGSGAFDVN